MSSLTSCFGSLAHARSVSTPCVVSWLQLLRAGRSCSASRARPFTSHQTQHGPSWFHRDLAPVWEWGKQSGVTGPSSAEGVHLLMWRRTLHCRKAKGASPLHGGGVGGGATSAAHRFWGAWKVTIFQGRVLSPPPQLGPNVGTETCHVGDWASNRWSSDTLPSCCERRGPFCMFFVFQRFLLKYS